MGNLIQHLLTIWILTFILGVFGDEHVVYWNSSNSLFRNQQPNIEVKMGDVVRFVCPDNEGRQNGEYLIVYEVSEFSRDDCALESNSREIIRCGPEGRAEKMLRSHQLSGRTDIDKKAQKIEPKNVAQLIRQITPIPNGKEYQVGQTYFYITTSSGKAEGINHRMYGLCESRNMRLSMKVFPAQRVSHPVKPIIPIRRQEDFVTKSSSEIMTGQEDEDSENDNAHLLPRDIEGSTNPKFRRPSQFAEAAASAGVQDQQFMKVVQLAQEGKTGTFENEKQSESRHSVEKDGWHPVNVQYVADLMNNAYKNADASATYHREQDFEIHEDGDLAVKSLEYSSPASSLISLITTVILLVIVLVF